jgi:hypothetical protein
MGSKQPYNPLHGITLAAMLASPSDWSLRTL